MHAVQHPSPARRSITTDLTTDDGRVIGADIELVAEPIGAVALAHPHPLYGGDRHHPLMTRCAQQLAEQGIDSIRFDFRREQADITSEIHDLAAAISALENESAATCSTVLGYSFGAMVALAAAKRLSTAHLVLIAPPLLSAPAAIPECPVTIVLGRHDQYCDPTGLASTPIGRSAHVHIVEGADHFLSGSIEAVATIATTAIVDHITENQ